MRAIFGDQFVGMTSYYRFGNPYVFIAVFKKVGEVVESEGSGRAVPIKNISDAHLIQREDEELIAIVSIIGKILL